MNNTDQMQEPKELTFEEGNKIVSDFYKIIRSCGDEDAITSYKTAMKNMTQGIESKVDNLKAGLLVTASFLKELPKTMQEIEGIDCINKKFRDNNLFELAEGRDNAVIIAEPSLQTSFDYFRQNDMVKIGRKVSDKLNKTVNAVVEFWS